jgi:phosphoribosyl-ATP pyrophosphohydrolase
MSYHVRKIDKGILGHWSKIQEEFDECLDAYEQENKILLLVELSDLLGAIDFFIQENYNQSISLQDLLQMDLLTREAFTSGHRK